MTDKINVHYHSPSHYLLNSDSINAGIDLYLEENINVYRRNFGRILKAKVQSVSIPEGYYGEIKCRSSLAAAYGMIVYGGIIDSGYTEPLTVMFSLTSAPHDEKFYVGHKFAQLVIHPIVRTNFISVSSVAELPSIRGAKGFGSSGSSFSTDRVVIFNSQDKRKIETDDDDDF